ncbi:DUF6706 family protein [Flavihumibacter petaseus]|uniref:Uncharacterized protein n=1 Tax=Flavihumibacter petaseus NBRC 106054 TaxID=1220578 RepID=A0A0E9N186_9BACT|nr:DUF6706 family protein [Flavihumibacter petaseus]GAO43792.1 hypothetical protein FPE01S_02_08980 [Flavihumibacter petaseus NBRC 106054]
MTVKEALIAEIAMSVDDMLVDKTLVDHGVYENRTYTKELSETIGKASIDILLSIWTMPDVSEGGYSVKYNRDAVKSRLLFLAGKYGRTDITDQLNPKPTVTSKTVW